MLGNPLFGNFVQIMRREKIENRNQDEDGRRTPEAHRRKRDADAIEKSRQPVLAEADRLAFFIQDRRASRDQVMKQVSIIYL